mgnify:CR=1 FL=1
MICINRFKWIRCCCEAAAYFLFPCQLLLRSDSVFSFMGKIGQFSFCLTFFVNLRQISENGKRI